MKKGNFIKKFMSPVLAASLLLGASATAGAANVALCDPIQGDIVTNNSTYITPITEPLGDKTINTGRIIDVSTITATTTVAKASAGSFVYREILPNGNDTYALGGGLARFKNNFTWEFDFCFDQLPSTGDAGSFYLQIGDAWQNAIKFWAKDMTTNGVTERKYYLRWGGGSDPAYYRISGGDEYYAESKPMLRQGCTYHLKIEADVRNQKIYTTFTNPYVTKDASDNWVLNDTPAAAGTEVWTYTSTSPAAFTSCTDTLTKILKGDSRADITLAAKSAAKLTLTNEKFYIDRIVPTTPELTLADNTVTAAAHAVNITNFNFYMKAPVLLCAVYKAGESGSAETLVAGGGEQPSYSPMTALTDYPYSVNVDVSDLADGTYTVKAFVWNTLGKLQPYDNCLTQKTLTVTDGVAAFAE